jgi:hypothetical protein
MGGLSLMEFNDHLQVWESPLATEIADGFVDFLHQLGGPTALFIPGKNPSRTRALTTLLHGNETSGAKAIHRWLKTGAKPEVNALLCILSVQTALTPPLFSHRHLPEIRDLNRCFRAPFTDPAGMLAARLLDLLRLYRPESLIDMHNTSGKGPAFGVATYLDDNHQSLIRIFGDQLIVTDLRLGALMELGDADFPTVTIECGGSDEPPSDQLAYSGLSCYLERHDVFDLTEPAIDLYYHPLRLELTPESSVCYSDQPQRQIALTMPRLADQLNRRVLDTETPIGWLGPDGLEALSARDGAGHNQISHFFVARHQQLFARRPLKLFMVTTNPEIARSDCLFYFVDAEASDP